MSSLRRIIFHGRLKKLIPEPITVFAESVAEAIKAVSLQCPELAPDPIRGRWRVQVKGCRTVESLFDTNNTLEEIHVFPQFTGGKRGGVFQILIGALLIVAAIAAAVVGMPWLSGMLLKVGALMLLGGVLQTLQQPKRDNASSTKKSYYLSSADNTVDIGTRISIVYGHRKIGGHILGFNINAEPATS